MNEKIAIIGGGIGGLYMGYKLQELGVQNWTIYNAGGRFGGKIHSNVYTDNDNKKLFCEWGAMRFEWGCQPYLEQLIEELKLDLIEFPPFCGDRGWELELIETICARIWRHFFDYNGSDYEDNLWNSLRQENRYLTYFTRLGESAWLPFGESTARPQDVYLLDWLESINPEWNKKLRLAEGSVRAFLGIEFNVLHWMSRWTKVMLANSHIKTCKNGNESIIEALVHQLDSNKLKANHQLVRLDYNPYATTDQYTLYFQDGSKESADTVVLAMPPRQLLNLDFDYPENVRDILESLHGYQLGRVFVRLKEPWWDADSFFAMQNEKADELFAREVYYYTLSSDEGVIMIYFGKDFMAYWSTLHQQGRLVDELARLLNIDKNRITDVRQKLWDGHTDVYAFQYLANGYAPHDTMQKFSVLNNKTLAILGDSFSFDAGFIEGVLTSCHYYLERNIINFSEQSEVDVW